MARYDNFIWKGQKHRATDITVVAVEEQIGHRLPSDFRDFIKKYHGARPSHRYFTITSGGKRLPCVVGAFLSLEPNDIEHLGKIATRLRDQIPSTIVPFACDPGGDMICFDFSGEKPVVVYWQHEEEGDTQFATVSQSFLEFIDLLQDFEKA